MDLQVRILNRAMSKLTHTSSESMGYALVGHSLPSIAAVFEHRAEELEGWRRGSRGEILGAILAHEIGHLLLGDNRHSTDGILRARWSDQDLNVIARARLWFSAEQADRMALTVKRRQAEARLHARHRLPQSERACIRAGESWPGQAAESR
jgi:hypothetical protein